MSESQKIETLKADDDGVRKKIDDLKKIQSGLDKKSENYKLIDKMIKDLDVVSGKIKFQEKLLSDPKLEIRRGIDGKILPESLLGEGRIILDPKDLQEMLTSGYFTQDPDHMGAIMNSIKDKILAMDPFPFNDLKEAIPMTNPQEYKTVSTDVKKMFEDKDFGKNASSAICYSFVNFVMQKANGITKQDFASWYIDKVKTHDIGIGTNKAEKRGIFQGTGDINRNTYKTGSNASDGINYGTYHNADITSKNQLQNEIKMLNQSSANTAIIYIDTARDGSAGDHFITVIRNKETGVWETADHTSNEKWRRGNNAFSDENLKNIKRITYVD
ncbi:hypothetical protein [Leptospira bandrabouensis]|uniref:Uncharacterized protein n=1 Tax=Leptospira bandrabouensis TaxID=2484903 RepID=A0A6H3P1T6_9LEPT|nr:hypothetical protein [Leptospira bandrabouensis]MCG6150472.1 hypothetical protein [Leptospira bandrabouensis]TGN05684.1 hypothetical protein EHR07_14075 [Leptospira bandrabouensis]TGN16015.1 hypothetical protein EHR08_06990 [Leptospira bandrabouensis]